MKPKTAETWAWVLIFGGLMLGSLGAFWLRAGGALGAVVALLGAVGVVAGVALIVWRSRLPRP